MSAQMMKDNRAIEKLPRTKEKLKKIKDIIKRGETVTRITAAIKSSSICLNTMTETQLQMYDEYMCEVLEEGGEND